MINADILKWCEEYTGEKFHAVLCDPPYELGFMGKSWDSTGIAFDPKTWKAIGDQLYLGAYLLAFGGTRTFHRIAVAIEDAGFEIRDTVMWVYGSGFPKSHNLKDEWKGYGTALKPSWEPIIIARKPLEGTVAQNALKYGSGALNIDGTRVGIDPTVDDKRLGGKGEWHIKREQSKDTVSLPPATMGSSALGRWPANLIHDGSDEVVGMFPNTKSPAPYARSTDDPTEYVGLTGTIRKKGDIVPGFGDSGSAARFFYSAKVSKRERDAGLEGWEIKRRETRTETGAGSWEEKGPQPSRNNHPTLKPISLTTYLAKLILPPKLEKPRRLLVPFAGSGSEVIGGYLAGWDEVMGIEQDAEYCKIAEARIKHWTEEKKQDILI